MAHVTQQDLDAGLAHILDAPKPEGTLAMIVRRPAAGQREILDLATLSEDEGLVGDNWLVRGSSKTPDGRADQDKQLNVMSWRVVDLLSRDSDHAALAGDQLFVDMDLSEANLPSGICLAIGDAVIQVTDSPHNGCKKFTDRFGSDATRWVNRGNRAGLRLRGLCARVVSSGGISAGDTVLKLN
jgi:MOSC domain-containing protein YiiM